MTRHWVATLFTLAVIGLGVYLLATHRLHIPGLFPEPVPGVQELEREAEQAGNEAEEEKREELEGKTDDEVAAGSAVADQHAADADERHTADADAEQRALDDLHRRLHEHLLTYGRPGEDDVQYTDRVEIISGADVDALLGHMRDRLLGRAAQPEARAGDGVRQSSY